MLLGELVAYIATSVRRQPPHHFFDDPTRLLVFKAAFPRPDLLGWFDDEGGTALAPRDYPIGLLFRTAAEWRREFNITQILSCGRAEHLARLAGIRRPDGMTEIVWHPELTEQPSITKHDVALTFGWFEEPADMPALRALLQWNTPHGLKVFVLGDAMERACIEADGSAPLVLPGRQIYRGELQSWPEARHVVICRSQDGG